MCDVNCDVKIHPDTDGARDTAADYMKDMMKSLPPMHSQPQGQPAAGSVPHQEGRLFVSVYLMQVT